MNAHSDNTAQVHPTTFPVPYSNQTASDDMEDALSMLRVVSELMSGDRAFGPAFINDLGIILWTATETLGPVLIHLREIDRNDRSGRYLKARRQWILQQSQGGVL